MAAERKKGTRKKTASRKKSTNSKKPASRKKSTSHKKSSADKKSSAKKSTSRAGSSSRKKTTRKKSARTTGTRKYSRGASDTVREEMHEFKRGKLKSGRSGKTVKNRKQAIAIGLSEARREGKRVPKKAARKRKSR